MGQVRRRAALRIGLKPARPAIQGLVGVAGLDLVRAGHQPGIDEVRRRIGDHRKLGVLGQADRHIARPAHVEEGRLCEALMANFDGVAQGAAL